MNCREICGVLLLIGAIAVVIMIPHPMEEEHFKKCVNEVARHAYVDADVGNTFDAGFDAGLVAAEKCK